MSNGFLLTRSPTGTGTSPQDSFGVKQYNMLIAGGDTITLDQIPFSAFASASWMITVIDDTLSTINSYQVAATCGFDSGDPQWILYSFVGTPEISSINVTVMTIDTNTKQMQLVITNNQSSSITVSYARYNLAT